ncbi:Hypp6618 [Branchiostoma lanceolatum]|uniref:Hypp6618 protein n=1 Tax=Branchiostoma lanceolatum TaxID=7740 RepID=A0A8J9YV97_BRALA|nr:Hypp6618 [Branchiostoma lanceolatum]
MRKASDAVVRCYLEAITHCVGLSHSYVAARGRHEGFSFLPDGKLENLCSDISEREALKKIIAKRLGEEASEATSLQAHGLCTSLQFAGKMPSLREDPLQNLNELPCERDDESGKESEDESKVDAASSKLANLKGTRPVEITIAATFWEDFERHDMNFLGRKDSRFAEFRKALDARMKELAADGVGTERRQADPLTQEDEDKLWTTRNAVPVNLSPIDCFLFYTFHKS